MNAEDEIISKASREVFFVFEIKIEDGKIVPKFLSDQQGILFTLGARDCLADLTDKHNQFSWNVDLITVGKIWKKKKFIT